MLKLSKDDRKNLRDAILSAYRTRKKLRIFVDDWFDINLNEFSSESDLTEAVFDLIDWAKSEGNIEALIIALYQEKPGNPEIQHFFKRIQAILQQRLILETDMGEASDFSFPLNWQGPTNEAELQALLPQRFSLETDVGTLQRGLKQANSVCKIAFTNGEECGTGVLIAKDLILTNYHVLSHDEEADLDAIARSIRFKFGDVSQELDRLKSVPIHAFSTDAMQPVLAASPVRALDYVLLRVEPTISQTTHIQPVLSDRVSHLSPNMALNLLQHPEGEEMKVSLSKNGVVKVDEQRGLVWYINRTKGGSSGSPCFDRDWRFVALHHRNLARSFGSVREGILYRSIYAEISQFL